MMQNRAAKARPNPHVQSLARKGRMGDTEIGHLTAGEVVLPKKVWQNDPSLATHATMAMAQAGLDPQQYVVGSSRNSRNPKTGAREFALQYTDQGWIDPAAGYNSPIDFSTYNPNGGGNQQAPEQCHHDACTNRSTRPSSRARSSTACVRPSHNLTLRAMPPVPWPRRVACGRSSIAPT